ncbi:MAG: FAD-dependent oxidoreductase [Armatimonadetes bacterium]|nr:FAD-dependent oxidoreductase [Armatimonadota bacterium]
MSDDDHRYDVIVCGGGMSGIAAAVASARNGADTLLIERYGFLGGMTTAGLVNPFIKVFPDDGQIFGGICKELIDRLASKGGCAVSGSFGAFDSELFKVVADEICLESGVKLLLHAFVSGVRLGGQWSSQITGEQCSCRADSVISSHSPNASGSLAPQIESVFVTCKPREIEITARVFVDATGNADLAFLAGAPCETDQSADCLAKSATVNFRMANVVTECIPSPNEIRTLCLAARDAGRINLVVGDLCYFPTIRSGEILFSVACTIRTEDPTQAEVELRRMVMQIADFLKSDVDGFEQAYLQMTGTQIGFWETRRIVGEYVLTAEDVFESRKFEDCIARGFCPMEIQKLEGGEVELGHCPSSKSFDIPYRCLVPLGIENLLVAGMSISATYKTHSLIRVMPVVCAVGEAAGTAAALCSRKNVAPRALDVRLLQSTLAAHGVNLLSERV